MAKQQLIELVQQLKKSGIDITFTKSKSALLKIMQQQEKFSPSTN
jgi:aryl carrier-like protein